MLKHEKNGHERLNHKYMFTCETVFVDDRINLYQSWLSLTILLRLALRRIRPYATGQYRQ